MQMVKNLKLTKYELEQTTYLLADTSVPADTPPKETSKFFSNL